MPYSPLATGRVHPTATPGPRARDNLARVTRLAASVLAALALGAALPSGAAALPPIKHVFIVVLENKDYDETFGADSKAPYLARTLPSMGVKLTNYYAIGHL